MSFLQRYADPESEAADVVVEDDDQVAYAYLRVDQQIVGDVWLFNSTETPQQVDFGEKDQAPFANPASHVVPSTRVDLEAHLVTGQWLDRTPYLVGLYLHEELFAVLAAGAKPGWSRLASKTSPVARPLADAPWPEGKVHHVDIAHYEDDAWTWKTETITSPSWAEVEAAIRAMHDFNRPHVTLHPTSADDHPDSLIITGGSGHWVLHDIGGSFMYLADPNGGDEEVEVWRSDQGYGAAAKHVVTDVDRVLRIARAYCRAGSCGNLNDIR